MEDTLREAGAKSVKNLKVSLNPCSNGRYSQRALVLLLMLVLRLNPCSNGRYSQRFTMNYIEQFKYVS